MSTAFMMEVRTEEIIEAVKKMKKREREDFIEDLIASTSPDYLSSIREARAEYKAGKIKTHKDLFDVHRSQENIED